MGPAVSGRGWVAGWNMPGYLPETEPEHFHAFADALAYLHDTVARWLDDDAALEADYRPAEWAEDAIPADIIFTTFDGREATRGAFGDYGITTLWIEPGDCSDDCEVDE